MKNAEEAEHSVEQESQFVRLMCGQPDCQTEAVSFKVYHASPMCNVRYCKLSEKQQTRATRLYGVGRASDSSVCAG